MTALIGDFSEHNGSIDWGVYARSNPNAAAYVRCGDGDHEDALYSKARINDMRKNHVTPGVYYFGRVANSSNGFRSPKDEVQLALGQAKAGGWGKSGDLKFAYDIEVANGVSIPSVARHVAGFIEAWPGELCVYTMPGFWGLIDHYLTEPQKLLIRIKTVLWVAHWGVAVPTRLDPFEAKKVFKKQGDESKAPQTKPEADIMKSRNKPEGEFSLRFPAGKRKYALHQFTDRGRMSGCPGQCDVSRAGPGIDRLAIR